MTHLDLFSGIGGFAYAVDQVWDDVEHIFCDNDKFCQQVLTKHWPEAEIYGDIRDIKTPINADILTGGFPCQPFSQAGKRKGTDDNRYLWPEMLRVIQLTQPQWIIAENVSGLLTMQDGLVFEQICIDLEACGYEVQPFIIPAASVGAPHKRDRVWICAHSNSPEYRDQRHGSPDNQEDGISSQDKPAIRARQFGGADTVPANSDNNNGGGRLFGQAQEAIRPSWHHQFERSDWDRDWAEIATELCSLDDGLPASLGNFSLSKPGHRNQQIKAYGNSIVPQVALEIMKGMSI